MTRKANKAVEGLWTAWSRRGSSFSSIETLYGLLNHVLHSIVFNRKQVDLCTSDNPDNPWGLSNRCVGFESVSLISDVLKMVKPSLVSLTTAKDGPSKEVRDAFFLMQLV